jgi:hypothetical protein
MSTDELLSLLEDALKSSSELVLRIAAGVSLSAPALFVLELLIRCALESAVT